MHNILKTIFLTFLINLSLVTLSWADCEGESLASASTWDNLRNTENSIKNQIGKLLAKATENKSKANFQISSIPNKFLSSYGDKDYCLSKLGSTKQKPLNYSSPTLGSLEELNAWIADFSQGKGAVGGELYKDCDKSCSPQYVYHISYSQEGSTKLSVKAEVICGEARDKDDNQYKITLMCKD